MGADLCSPPGLCVFSLVQTLRRKHNEVYVDGISLGMDGCTLGKDKKTAGVGGRRTSANTKWRALMTTPTRQQAWMELKVYSLVR
jgi:hypothetical protein